MLDQLLKRFAQQAPVATMVRALLANILSAKELDALFRETAVEQYEGELLFSSIVELLHLVVTKSHKSLNAAYQMHKEQLSVSVAAVYDKLLGVEICVTSELVSRTAEKMAAVIEALEPNRPSTLQGYDVRILDGSHLAATEHRICETRRLRGGPLPGQCLAVLDPRLGLIEKIIPCKDGHAQERSLLVELVDLLRPNQLWIADRNFCTTMWLLEIDLAKAFFLIRHHAGMALECQGELRRVGCGPTGEVWEQIAILHGEHGDSLRMRRIVVKLDRPTENGDREIVLLTNLPECVSALSASEEYHGRWSIEAVFGEVTLSLNGEINTLGYPGAALLGYALALVTYNVLSVVKSAVRAAQGPGSTANMSTYYLASEVANIWGGLEIAIPTADWEQSFASLSPRELAQKLQGMARHVELRRYLKHPRGVKKKPPPRIGSSPHVSTQRLLEKRSQ